MLDLITIVDSTAVADTLKAVVNAIPADKQVEFYKELLASQTHTSDLINRTLIGILAAFTLVAIALLGINFWWMVVRINKKLENQKEVFDNTINKIKAEQEVDFHLIRGNIELSFAYTNAGYKTPRGYVIAIDSMQEALIEYHKAKEFERMGDCAKDFLSILTDSIPQKQQVKIEINEIQIITFDQIKKTVGLIPDTYSKVKKEILELITEIENAEPPDTDLPIAPPSAEPEV